MADRPDRWHITRCPAFTTLSQAEQDTIDAVEGGECPPEPARRCELIGGHEGLHHAHVQTTGNDTREMWLIWGDAHAHEFQWLPECTLTVPMSTPGYTEPKSAGTSCMLFHGHNGAHDLGGGQLWWWGDRRSPFAGPMRHR